MEIGFLLIGLLVGALAVWFFAKAQQNAAISAEQQKWQQQLGTLAAEKSTLEERVASTQRYFEESKHELREKVQELSTLSSQYSKLQSDTEHLKQRLEEQKSEMENLQQRFTTEFKNIANDLLEEKSKKFTEQNKVNISEILNPLNERIKEFKEKVESSHKEHISTHAGLIAQITQLRDLNLQMSQEALNLTKALKGESKTQGNWGEMILERLLERSGLSRGQEYVIQENLMTEDGKRYQPDVVIKLPDNKNIIIDSKVSLVAYERYHSCEQEIEKAQYLREHINSIKLHVKQLSNKEYQKLYQLGSLDFVLMFIPVESAFALAFQNDQELYNEALEKHIVIVSTSTLLATLRTINSIWKQEYQNRNALEIARQGGDLYDKFVAFMEDLVTIGKKIDDSKASYSNAMGKLVDGRGNLIKRAESLKALGAKTSKSFSPQLLQRADISEEIVEDIQI
ncbi:MAG: DNA recombination protein RmuC [Chitinophagales bacterium]|nr:DNA recombination protein RmuC [Chitinophagales bacterium]